MKKTVIQKATIYNGDCMEFMKDCEDNQFDLAIVDPPYGIGAGSTSFKNGTRKKSQSKFFTPWIALIGWVNLLVGRALLHKSREGFIS